MCNSNASLYTSGGRVDGRSRRCWPQRFNVIHDQQFAIASPTLVLILYCCIVVADTGYRVQAVGCSSSGRHDDRRRRQVLGWDIRARIIILRRSSIAGNNNNNSNPVDHRCCWGGSLSLDDHLLIYSTTIDHSRTSGGFGDHLGLLKKLSDWY